MSEEEKKPWDEQAACVAKEHRRLFPNWKYQPGSKRARRRQHQVTP